MSRTIGLNTLFLIPNAVGGTENYTRTFIESLEATNTESSYIIFCNRENFETFIPKASNFKKIRCPVYATNRLARILYEQFVFPFLIQTYQCDVIHSFGYTGPACVSAKKLVTIHDANWLDHPEDNSKVSQIILSCIMALVVRTADGIITDSSFSRSRLAHFYPKLQSKIHVILPWVGDQLLREFGRRHDNPLPKSPYLLCVSGLYPHKKISYLLDIVGDLPLVLIGKNGIEEKQIQSRVKKLKNVHYFPKVSLAKLAAYYQHAAAFVFPSVYEGFGYPVYEALAIGLPIVVGKKELYEKAVRSKLTQLTFDPAQDKVVVPNVLENTSSRTPMIFSKNKSIENLIEMYATV